MTNKFICNIKKVDSKIYEEIKQENFRQENNIELIASENYASEAVMAAQGSILTNKYAEGYPGNRYYGGCKHIDVIEEIAINRVKKIFGAESANVQPHSGSQANQAVLFAMLKLGDTIMGMSLKDGGHLTHGSSVNISGKCFNVISYGLDEKEDINYLEVETLARKYRPKLIIAGASSFSLKINFKRFSEIAKDINAYLLVDMAHYAGLIAANLYPNPVPYADFVTTTTHKSLRGPRGGVILMQSKYEKIINASIFPGIQGGPLMHIIAAKAVAFKEALSSKFILYQKQVLKNANTLANTLIQNGFNIVSGRTECHLILIKLDSKNITGKKAETILGSANIIVNKNIIPKDKEKPSITSGIRIGSLAITTRGFKYIESKKIAQLVSNILNNPKNYNIIFNARSQVINLAKKFPIYS